MDWKDYFTQRPTLFNETEFLKQVHKTVSGQPITAAQFNAQISDIKNALEINNNDFVLDMCCGNGIITIEISKECHSIVGVDFSEPLINIAKKYNNPDNTSYYCMSVLDIELTEIIKEPFTKIYMYEALQHFSKDDFQKIMKLIREISTPDALTFFGGIPDEDKIWDFYDTPERRQEYELRKSNNQDPIGTWWKKEDFMNTCLQNRFECEVLNQNPELHSAHYRFDALISTSFLNINH